MTSEVAEQSFTEKAFETTDAHGWTQMKRGFTAEPASPGK
jgi:hypothetical protein